MRHILLTSLLLLSIHTCYAQSNDVFSLGKVEHMHSKVLGENRILNIYLPDGYDTNKTMKYPVIYLLDGSAHEDFVHIVGIVQFLNMIEFMPQSIVIGIANVDRKRDFTFPSSVAEDKKLVPTGGGSAKFIDYLEKEVQPFIENKYRTNDSKTIIGQSLGGLLATEVLVRKPSLFNKYIIVSPSLWWGNEALLADAQKVLATSLPANDQVYIAVGTEEKQMIDDAQKLYDILKQYNKDNSAITYHYLPEEDHLTILHNCIYKAFVEINKKK